MVVGPGLVSTSPDFMRIIASHPAGPHGRLAKKTVIGPPLLGAGAIDTICKAAVTASPRVGCVVWSRNCGVINYIIQFITICCPVFIVEYIFS